MSPLAATGLTVMGWIGCGLLAAAPARLPNTQLDGQPLPPAEAVKRFHAPPGFKVTLAAAEPDVGQPVAIAYDHRGRLWVAECNSYDGSEFVEGPHDRILIFEDADGDRVFESRKVFAEGLSRLTGIELGFGGVWVTCAPNLAFIPDRDADDRPDGPAVVLLDGWTLHAEHNSVNGLTWGPDGWLYGRHGIKNRIPSRVGKPGARPSERVELTSCIWRFHPTGHEFQIVADGTVNPWGLDFDENGQAFMSSSVVDHLWHVVPGARFERWKGQPHPYPRTYEMMNATSDHLHYGGGEWNQGGRLSASNDNLGGGHSHSDAMIYQGGRWPDVYRGKIFLSNIHGRRIVTDDIVRKDGTGRFVARHLPHFLTVDDPWFRAISLKYGPDGNVVMTDWSDYGECHDRDGVHRTSGRIYVISWGEERAPSIDVAALSVEELVALQTHDNEWHVRHSRRRLQELASAGVDMTTARGLLRSAFATGADRRARLRAMWSLFVTGGIDASWLRPLLGDADEHIRYWAVRLLTQIEPAENLVAPFIRMTEKETSWLARLSLASALRRMDTRGRLALATALDARMENEIDPNLTRMLWYGFEPCVSEFPSEAVAIARTTRIPRLRSFIARRLAEEIGKDDTATAALLRGLREEKDPTAQRDLLEGANRGLKGKGWVGATADSPDMSALLRSGAPDTRRLASLFLATLGNTDALDAVKNDLRDATLDSNSRLAALERLSEIRPPGFLDFLLELLEDATLVDAVMPTLTSFDDPRVAEAIIAAYPSFPRAATRLAAVSSLAIRSSYARKLLDAVASGRIDRRDIPKSVVRKVSLLGDAAIVADVEKRFGTSAHTPEQMTRLLTQYRHTLSPAVLADANLADGATAFMARCGACHTLFGQGGNVGPDLTGSGRKNLDYLLLKILDPSASISSQYQLSSIQMSDGRVLLGSVASETADTLTVRTTEGEVTLPRNAITKKELLPMSLMPPGLLDGMPRTEMRDLFGYLMSDGLKGKN